MKVSAALLLFSIAALHAQSVVAPDGSAPFKSVQQAVDAAPSHSRTRFTIHLKPGIYHERVTVPPEKTFLTLEGEDPLTTVITAGIHAGMPGPDGRPLITFGTPTVFIQANDFTAQNLTFENSAGAQGQALALTIMSDRGVFRNCRFLGYQDTLLAQAGRQYFDKCYIEGAVDFIFGGSAAWFENCEIHVKANGYITAPNTPKDQRYGYVFSHSKITSEPNVQTFLSRPWRPYGITYFLDTEMPEAVRPAGWNNWNDPSREKTARYGEYHSSGPGGNIEGRARWGHNLTDAEAHELSLEAVLAGIDGWNPKTGTVRSAVSVSKEPTAAKTAAAVTIPAAIPRDTLWIATTDGRNPTDPARIAYSANGYQWTESRHSLPSSTVGQKQMIDPRVVEGPDHVFHLVWATAAKGDKGFGYANSQDLVQWSEPKYVEVMAKEEALNLASPNLFYDEVSRRFVVTWASTIARNFIQSFQEEVEDNPRIWYTTTRDFEQFAPPELLFDPNYSVQDGVLLEDRGRYMLLHNDNTRPMLNLRVSASSTPFGPWGPSSDAFSEKFTDSPAAIQLGREWWIYFRNTQRGSVGLMKTRDFRTFQDASARVAFPEGRRPIAVLKVERRTLEHLLH